METRETYKRSVELLAGFWEDKIDRPLKARLRKSLKYIKAEMKEETLQLRTELQRTIRNYCEQLYANKLLTLEEMDKFLEMYNLRRLNHIWSLIDVQLIFAYCGRQRSSFILLHVNIQFSQYNLLKTLLSPLYSLVIVVENHLAIFMRVYF